MKLTRSNKKLTLVLALLMVLTLAAPAFAEAKIESFILRDNQYAVVKNMIGAPYSNAGSVDIFALPCNANYEHITVTPGELFRSDVKVYSPDLNEVGAVLGNINYHVTNGEQNIRVRANAQNVSGGKTNFIFTHFNFPNKYNSPNLPSQNPLVETTSWVAVQPAPGMDNVVHSVSNVQVSVHNGTDFIVNGIVNNIPSGTNISPGGDSTTPTMYTTLPTAVHALDKLKATTSEIIDYEITSSGYVNKINGMGYVNGSGWNYAIKANASAPAVKTYYGPSISNLKDGMKIIYYYGPYNTPIPNAPNTNTVISD